MSDAIITVEGLGKKYSLRHQTGERYTALRDMVAEAAARPFRRLTDKFKFRNGASTSTGDLNSPIGTPSTSARNLNSARSEEFWALRDINFEVRCGEVIGIIGRNGAGKSTLLKILSRITEPTTGRIKIKGRVASLLEVGTGFHPELTGRENIFLNGAILGMNRHEIKAKFDEIVAFAEIEGFLDTPVKRYSSGMYVRLAFAVAAHLDPEILIVDEVLAVGDAGFQKKCLGKMKDVAGKRGRTVLFVSHNMPAVQQLCNSGLMLSDGLAVRGDIPETIASYMSHVGGVSRRDVRSRTDREGDGRLRVVDVTLHDESGAQTKMAVCGQSLRVRIHYESEFSNTEHSVDAAFNLRNSAGILLTCFENIQAGAARLLLYPKGYFECRWPKASLRSGTYYSTVFVGVDGVTSDWLRDAFKLDVEEGNFFGTGYMVPRDQGDVVFEQSWVSVGAEL